MDTTFKPLIDGYLDGNQLYRESLENLTDFSLYEGLITDIESRSKKDLSCELYLALWEKVIQNIDIKEDIEEYLEENRYSKLHAVISRIGKQK